ncbi:MAG: hypothetical protein HGN29_15890 [Asgard group archaeon]|nr:hypothetical protein [Asgard group archaeon]
MLLLVFCPLSFTSQAENYWGISRDTYTYSQVSERTRYDIEGSGGLEYSNTTTEEVMIWDVVSNENIITFRTTKWVTFLGYIHCESEECYDEFLEALEYDDETESVKATYVYNDTEQKVGFVDPRNNEFLGFEANIPIDPIDLPMPMGMWDYIGCLFLPVLSPSFSFETNYTVYELIYTDFELEFKNSFRMQRKKFEGYSYNYEYTFFIEIVDFPGKKIFNKALFQYNNQGVLYNYEGKNEEYREVNGKYKLYLNHEMTYTIDEIDEELAVSLQWIFGFVGLVFIAISYRIYLSKR